MVVEVQHSGLSALHAAGAVPQRLAGSVTFVAGTTGATGQHSIFTITGLVEFKVGARCTSDLTSGGAATLSIGNPGAPTEKLAATLATTIDAGDFYWAAGGDLATNTAGFSDAGGYSISSGTDLISEILTTTITGGVLEYYMLWVPITPGAIVTLGAELTQI